MFTHRSQCRLCGSTELVKVISLTPTPPANAFVDITSKDLVEEFYPLDLYFCNSCHHSQLLDVVSAHELFDEYLYLSSTSPVMQAYLRDEALRITKFLNLAPGSLVVEFGSNDGALLRCFKQLGMRVLGIEPANNIVSAIEDIPIINDYFSAQLADTILEQYGPADLICAYNVFAHIDNLRDVTLGVSKLLSPKAHFVFEVGYLADVYSKNLFDTIYHEHLDYHRVEPLRRFFSSCGLNLIHTERSNIQGGALVGHASKDDTYILPSVQHMIEMENNARLNCAETYVSWGQQINKNGVELLEYLKKLKASGNSIVGYGAPAKATTLMHHYGIDSEIIDYIVDDNLLKQGLYSPGLHIPIKNPKLLYEDKPDLILVLAWNFADSIIESHSALLQTGSSFIVPLPSLRIVSAHQ